jgi:hypothetical protein
MIMAIYSFNELIELNKNILIDLRNNGFCFIKFTDNFNSQVNLCKLHINNFFNLNLTNKNLYSYNYGIGYYDMPYKQHFKYLTNKYNLPDLENNNNNNNNNIRNQDYYFRNSVLKISKYLDKLMMILTKKILGVFNIKTLM